MIMSKKFTTPFPDHALAEMDDPQQRKFWEGWAAVGDAKIDEAAASRAVIDAEARWHECCIAHRVNLPLCGCGKHPGLYARAVEKRDKARVDVAKLIDKFKKV